MILIFLSKKPKFEYINIITFSTIDLLNNSNIFKIY